MPNMPLIAASAVVTLACGGYFAYGMLSSVASVEAPASVVEVSSQERQMNAAIEEAQATINDFYVMLKRGTEGVYMVKYPLETDGRIEDVWMKVERVTKTEFIGSLDSEPTFTDAFAVGSQVRTDRADISDWMVHTQEGIHGAQTIRASLSVMPEAEAAAMRAQLLD